MTKPPITRTGTTHKIRIGEIKSHITVNRDAEGTIIEVFAKADSGAQGHMDMVCRLISLGLQGRADIPTVIRHMRYDRTEPCGGPGQASSIYDAIARMLDEESGGGNDQLKA